MSLEDRDDVPDARSRASTSATLRPRETASSAVPVPTTPPPTMAMSNSSARMRFSASARICGLIAPREDIALQASAALVRDHPASGPLQRPAPVRQQRLALVVAHVRLVAGRLGPQRPPVVLAPRPGRDARQVGGAEYRRVGDLGYDDRDADHVGL